MNLPHNPFATTTTPQPTCMDMLQIILDGDPTAEQRHFFSQHMGQCSPCFKSYEVELAIKELLKAKCCGEAPTGLIDEIKSKLNGQIKL